MVFINEMLFILEFARAETRPVYNDDPSYPIYVWTWTGIFDSLDKALEEFRNHAQDFESSSRKFIWRVVKQQINNSTKVKSRLIVWSNIDAFRHH